MYQCSNCGGELKYDITSGKLHCAYCDKSTAIESMSRKSKLLEKKYSVFSCPNCGGEIVTNDSVIADFCSYCGAPVALHKQEANREMPRQIVPFEVTLKECEDRYINYIKKMPYVPSEYKEKEAELDFRGIYIPFHSYDVEVEGQIQYKAEDDELIDRIARKHKVDIYDITKHVSGSVKNIVHDASETFSDRISEAIAAGNTKAKEFHPAYLSGFYAEMQDVGSESYEEYAKKEVEKNITTLVREKSDKKYKEHEKRREISYKARCQKDVLHPVWFLARKTKKRVAYAVVNGKTKDIEVDIPFDWKKLLLGSLITSLVLYCLFDWLFTFTPKGMMKCAAIFIYLSSVLYFSNIKSLYKRELNGDEKTGIWKTIGDRIPCFLYISGWILAICALIIAAVFLLFEASLPQYCLCFFVLIVIRTVRYVQKWIAIEKHGTHPTKAILLTYLASILLIAISIWNPVHDYWYYIGAGISLGAIVITLLGTINDYNLLCSSPLPQFTAYKGGLQDEQR